MAKQEFRYVCMNTSCGAVEYTTYAPCSTQRCPKCVGGMRRETVR